MSPPGQTATMQPPGGSTPFRAGSHIELAIRAAHKALIDSGVEISPRKVNRIVRTFAARAKRSGTTFHQFLADAANLTDAQRRTIHGDADLARACAYLDPVGELAVNRVMRERGW
ncbi:hypothetical protein [Mycolicibacterium palauense]|uniref:hypothetical protein n=1 Tax=Mycolicibacterium palauense TaxID=2034511 RepID=UPI001FE9CC3A|nr:hypothetical protein [Mycolicibacterium palauense]